MKGGIANAVAVTAPRIRNLRREIVMLRFLSGLIRTAGIEGPIGRAGMLAGLVLGMTCTEGKSFADFRYRVMRRLHVSPGDAALWERACLDGVVSVSIA
jgi:hypothetical protein